MVRSELEELKSSRLLAQAGLLVAACDSAGRMELMSPGLQDLLGLPFERVHEEQMSSRFQLFARDGSTPLPTEEIPLVRARRGEVVRDALIVVRSVAGDVLYLRCNASPLHDADGRPDGAMVLVQDVTGEQVAKKRQLELRDRLLHTINHHLRTPVTALLGYTEILEEQREGIAAEGQHAVDAVLRAAHSLRGLLENVSALVDLDRHTQITKAYGDLVPVLQEEVCAHMPMFEQNHVALRLEQPQTLPVVVDFAEIRRAVSELLRNAACHAPAGSVVRLSARGDGPMVYLTVADNGPGIEISERERIVQPFERGVHPHQDVAGRGLGLAIAATIASAHGGELRLSQTDPRGLSASLRLPVR